MSTMHEGKRFRFKDEGQYKATVRLDEFHSGGEVRIEEGDRGWMNLSPESAHKLADWIKENVPSNDEIRLRFAEREAKEAVDRLAKLKRQEVRDESE